MNCASSHLKQASIALPQQQKTANDKTSDMFRLYVEAILYTNFNPLNSLPSRLGVLGSIYGLNRTKL